MTTVMVFIGLLWEKLKCRVCFIIRVKVSDFFSVVKIHWSEEL